MPNLQKLLKEQFSKAEFLNSIPQDEVIAIGGAKQAAILTGNEEETKRNEQDVNLPCLAHAIVAKVVYSILCIAIRIIEDVYRV